jgi:CheY-like chemotaxis protein
VVLIDRDASFAAHLSRAVDPDQIELVSCGSPVEALHRLTALGTVDLVVIDLELAPSQSGTTVLEAVRGLEQGGALKIVALGSGAPELDGLRGRAKAHADLVLPRHLPLVELAQRLREAIA